MRTVKKTSGSIIERERQDKRERGREKREREMGLVVNQDQSRGKLRSRVDALVALDRNRNEIILSRKKLYPMPILPVISFNLRL